jgi:hypothetical protein
VATDAVQPNDRLPACRFGLTDLRVSNSVCIAPPGPNCTIGCQPVDAAALIWDVGIQVVSLRNAATVITAAGREISREVGQVMRLRF